MTPTSLADNRVTLTVHLKKRAGWAKLKTSSAKINPKGKYRWKYMPPTKGVYRMRAQVAASALYPAAATKWQAFTVKQPLVLMQVTAFGAPRHERNDTGRTRTDPGPRATCSPA